MKKFVAFSTIALAFMACLAGTADKALANVKMIPASVLRNQGVVAKNLEIVGFSPDNKYAFGWSREPRSKTQPNFRMFLHIIPINPDNSIGKPRAFQINLPVIDQLCFTPDSKSVIIISKRGTTFIKVDVETGKTTTIMEHIAGKPGFRSYPDILTLNNGQILVRGYFYDEEDYASVDSIAILDPNKTGIDAFTLGNEIHKAQYATRKGSKIFVDNYPRKDVGFTGVEYADKAWTCYRWVADKGYKSFDKGTGLYGFWAADSRLLYSLEREGSLYDLKLYDALTDENITISKDQSKPYLCLYLSSDGKTALFNETDLNSTSTKILYARESEGWEVKPISGLDKKIVSGVLRLSPDGTKAIQCSDQGLYIMDVK